MDMDGILTSYSITRITKTLSHPWGLSGFRTSWSTTTVTSTSTRVFIVETDPTIPKIETSLVPVQVPFTTTHTSLYTFGDGSVTAWSTSAETFSVMSTDVVILKPTSEGTAVETGDKTAQTKGTLAASSNPFRGTSKSAKTVEGAPTVTPLPRPHDQSRDLALETAVPILMTVLLAISLILLWHMRKRSKKRAAWQVDTIAPPSRRVSKRRRWSKTMFTVHRPQAAGEVAEMAGPSTAASRRSTDRPLTLGEEIEMQLRNLPSLPADREAE